MIRGMSEEIGRAALACMAKVSFTPEQLIVLLGLAVFAGLVIGVLGTLLLKRRP